MQIDANHVAHTVDARDVLTRCEVVLRVLFCNARETVGRAASPACTVTADTIDAVQARACSVAPARTAELESLGRRRAWRIVRQWLGLHSACKREQESSNYEREYAA